MRTSASFPLLAVSNDINNTVGCLFELTTGPTDHVVVQAINIDMYPNVIGGGNYMNWGVGKPAAAGVGGINPILFPLWDDTSNTNSISGLQLFTQWRIPPTIPANFFRRYEAILSGSRPSCEGEAFFPNGFRLAPSSSIVAWVIQSGPTGFGTNVQFNSTITVEV